MHQPRVEIVYCTGDPQEMLARVQQTKKRVTTDAALVRIKPGGGLKQVRVLSTQWPEDLKPCILPDSSLLSDLRAAQTPQRKR